MACLRKPANPVPTHHLHRYSGKKTSIIGLCAPFQPSSLRKGDRNAVEGVYPTHSFRHFLAKMPPTLFSARPAWLVNRKRHPGGTGNPSPTLLRSLDEAKTLAFSRPRGNKNPCAKHNRSAPQAHLFSSPFSFLSSPNFMPRKTKICPLAKAYFCFEAGYLVVCSATVSVSSLGRKRSEMHQMLARATSV